MGDPRVWLLPLPIFCAVLPSILLSGIPDLEPDRTTGKRTLAVQLGPRRTAFIAIASAVAAEAAAFSFFALKPEFSLPQQILQLFITVHLGIIVGMLASYIAHGSKLGRINTILATSICYVLWFPIHALWER